jgi:GNAT superfamily N-acetyltransferase
MMDQDRWMELKAWTSGPLLEPVDGGVLARLHDGSTALLRPVHPGDKMRIEEGLSSLSPQSVYYRFGRQLRRLTDRDLTYFTEVDQDQHVAWAAVDPHDPAEAGLGIARMIRESRDAQRAEVALTVIDSHHGLGLGTILLATLHALARKGNLKTLRACVMRENHAVVAWFQRLGARPVESDCQVILDWDLTDPACRTDSAQRLMELSHQIQRLPSVHAYWRR